MMGMTINRLYKELGKLIESGHGRKAGELDCLREYEGELSLALSEYIGVKVYEGEL